jgi:RNA polymerase sigma factor (sigma-70 family)
VDATARQEFLEFCQARTPALFRVAYGITVDQHLAEDLLQTALEGLVRRWHHVDKPEAYVRRIMVNEAVTWWRRWRRREALTPTPPEHASAFDTAGGPERALAATGESAQWVYLAPANGAVPMDSSW